MFVFDWYDLPVIGVLIVISAIWIRNKMSALNNLTAAVEALKGAHSNLFSHVQLHTAQSEAKVSGAGSANEAAIQAVADQVNGIVAQVNEEIAKIPVVANV